MEFRTKKDSTVVIESMQTVLGCLHRDMKLVSDFRSATHTVVFGGFSTLYTDENSIPLVVRSASGNYLYRDQLLEHPIVGVSYAASRGAVYAMERIGYNLSTSTFSYILEVTGKFLRVPTDDSGYPVLKEPSQKLETIIREKLENLGIMIPKTEVDKGLGLKGVNLVGIAPSSMFRNFTFFAWEVRDVLDCAVNDAIIGAVKKILLPS